ncbi:transcriptional regulator, LuxR family [Catenulispora acidiphila DSM 44928]|uniref:Transcriptional regulator, LuxR family n=1 Tax=Catenulispora acidiphila (strain DSM 44928 / JCM 14897 / NBRC 102108 / NRRL B-24433 / ID139908) TaxID=479433 RepID=C7Q4F3_CATAD|nr:LuxR C-terminal-related transcriptional regulator [Catenulispora acidiphila]ACU71922.1 transcriptional regulator, LuxR family [Catenulispora acidiphila DSM 44928]
MSRADLPEYGEEPTKRELQIVKRLALGQTNIELGRHFKISEYTIKSHLARISAKLGVQGRNAIVAAALEEEWLRLPKALVLAQAEKISQHRRLAKVRSGLGRQSADSGRAA